MEDDDLKKELQSLENDLKAIVKRLSAINQPALLASLLKRTDRDEKWERIYEKIIVVLRDKPDRVIRGSELQFRCSPYKALNPTERKAVLQNMVARGLITMNEKYTGRRPATIIALVEKRALALPGRKDKPTETSDNEY